MEIFNGECDAVVDMTSKNSKQRSKVEVFLFYQKAVHTLRSFPKFVASERVVLSSVKSWN